MTMLWRVGKWDVCVLRIKPFFLVPVDGWTRHRDSILRWRYSYIIISIIIDSSFPLAHGHEKKQNKKNVSIVQSSGI